MARSVRCSRTLTGFRVSGLESRALRLREFLSGNLEKELRG